MDDPVKYISSRLSLRRPQRESLEILARILERVDFSRDADLFRSLESVRSMYPSVQDFERDFPSVCFALATGVGKTRLMGAFISYLYLTRRSRHFLILAPGLTIYEKLKMDFSPRSPKYVFSGISEFVSNRPGVITGENYETGEGVRFDENDFRGQRRFFDDGDTPFINIFNISKINAVENQKGAKKTRTPRIRRLQEALGESYYEYLSGLPDLVVLMDESHRYRATAAARAINELKPVLGIELTATPKTAGAAPADFRNTAYSYSLPEAMEDRYVKEPAVATRRDFKVENCSPEQLERIKLEDGIHCHELVKTELEVYAQQRDKKLVKPFVLVVAQDTDHARQLRKLIESDAFFGGRYRGKIAEVHSKQSGAEGDENIQKLISIEDPDEPTEIVIHVNKLKEGWDVTNLYTIIPLRASVSEILTEQTIGRGLRLPYGRRTGHEDLDRLTIVAHDRFQDIIDRANDPNSIIRAKIEIGEGGDVESGKPRAVTVPSRASMALAGSSLSEEIDHEGGPAPVIRDPRHQRIAEAVMKVAEDYGHLKNSRSLSAPGIREQIIKKTAEMTGYDAADKVVEEVVGRVTENLPGLMIDIPDIMLKPDREVTYGFHDLDLDGLENLNLRPVSDEILLHYLRTNRSDMLSRNGGHVGEENPENHIVRGLSALDLISYDEHSDLLYKLAEQAVAWFKSYLTDKEVGNVLIYHQRTIVDFIEAHLRRHYWETPAGYQAVVSKGFVVPGEIKYAIQRGEKPRNFRSIPENRGDVRKIVFGGFAKCCYPLQKFDSVEGELRFSQLLEDDEAVILWMKPAPRSFRIDYRRGESYEPDFVVETAAARYICEVKMASEATDDTVKAKSAAAGEWCEHATRHARESEDKPWRYVLIPHNAIRLGRSFEELVKEYTSRPEDLF